MCCQIFLIDEKVNYDILPVALIENYHWNLSRYAPYTQSKICFSDMGLQCKFIVFEANPDNDSFLRFIFTLDNEKFISIDVFPNHKIYADFNGENITSMIKFHFSNGEDLQGVYWSADITISYDLIHQYYPNFTITENQIFYGNIFKLCKNGEKKHFGSLFPCDTDFDQKHKTLGKFIIKKY